MWWLGSSSCCACVSRKPRSLRSLAQSTTGRRFDPAKTSLPIICEPHQPSGNTRAIRCCPKLRGNAILGFYSPTSLGASQSSRGAPHAHHCLSQRTPSPSPSICVFGQWGGEVRRLVARAHLRGVGTAIACVGGLASWLHGRRSGARRRGGRGYRYGGRLAAGREVR